MSSIPGLSEKERDRKPAEKYAAYKGVSRYSDEKTHWGDTPSFSFDYYDKDTQRGSVISQHQHDTKLEDLRPVRRFLPDSFKSFFRRSRNKGEPLTARNLGIDHCSPPVTPLLDNFSRESSLGDKKDLATSLSSSLKCSQEFPVNKQIDSLPRKSEASTSYEEKRIDRPKRIVFQDEVEHLRGAKGIVTKTIHFSEKGSDTGPLNRSIPYGHRPKPHVVPDYLLKYPEIHTAEERESYKAVFNDQYSEYKDLHAEVKAAMVKFKELDIMMDKLTRGPQSKTAPERIQVIAQKYEKKKNEPTFIEKKERCIYLKGKLTHIKKQIQAFDLHQGTVYF
ncbi:MARVEL domain-containing protein 2 isoform X2 [Xenopus laevis]|uniref:MARVEL domain-containing protein 2 isoform X2 n=1 Tax=Xenopus laevis TaxID=8355 RepID=A0A8J1KRM5_XENLA|nr:MARVEL domain-containing protein 2 isoform X2 [Xenopus laevis]